MIAGAAAISSAEAPQSERDCWQQAVKRECGRYGLDPERIAAAVSGGDPVALEKPRRRWWELLIAAAALAVFVWLGLGAQKQPIAINVTWGAALAAASVVLLIACGALLWKRTRFS
jgi:hypothetical protein